MLVASFALGIIVLTIFFDGLLTDQLNPNRDPQYMESSNGVRQVRLERNRQGHYVANGSIDNVPVTFLLDTGATDVAIPREIAEAAGLESGFVSQANTANGVVTVYSTRVDRISLGNIEFRNVRASITPSMPGNTVLLGMSALQQIEFTQRGSTLTLRQFPD